MKQSQEHRKRIGDKFRAYRMEQGWGIEQVAMMADCKPATVEKIEAGAFNVPLDVLTKVAEVIGCELTIKEK